MNETLQALPWRFLGQLLAGTLDCLGSGLNALADGFTGAACELSEALAEHEERAARKARNERQLDKARRSIERIEVAP